MLPESKRMNHFRHLCAGLACLTTLATVPAAWALDDSDKESVRMLSNAAATEFEQGKFEAARDKFTRAYALAKVPRLAVWVGRANERLGKLVIAYEFYRQALGLERNELWMGDIQTVAQKEAEKALESLAPRLAKITIVVEGAPATEVKVTLDGVAVSAALLGIERLVDPGQREIVGTHGNAQVRESSQVEEGDAATVVLRFQPQAQKPAPTPSAAAPAVLANHAPAAAGVRLDSVPSNSQRTWGWVGIGVGGAGLLTGAVSGLLVLSKYSDLKEDCPALSCGAKYSDRVESYRTMRTVSTVGFVAAGVGAAVGVTLLLTSPSRTPTAAQNLSLWVTPEMAGVVGTF